MPRIAHVISTRDGLGGAEAVLIALVRAGTERGYEQLVLNPFAGEAQRRLASACSAARYEPVPCHGMLQLPLARSRLARALDLFSPDVVHAHLFHALVLTASLPRPAGAARLLSHQHTGYLRFEHRRAEEYLDRVAGRRYDRVVAISDWSRSELLERYGYPEDRVESIRNGWEGEPAAGIERAADPTIVCVANFRWQKGHRHLIAAFARVREELPAARLVLVGEGRLEGEVREQVGGLGLEEAVEFAGSSDDIWPFLARAHLFAMSSVYEPLGIVIMEAMAAGLPVVATAVGGIPELVEAGATGELVPESDVEALATSLAGLLRDPKRRERMGANARVAAEGLRMEKMVDAYYDLYARLIAERR